MTKDNQIELDAGLTGLEGDAWFSQLETICDDLGYFEQLDDHAAAFVDAGPKLLVTFEDAETIQNNDRFSEPFGFRFVRENGWSHLAIIAPTESWYREKRIYGYFDRLIDDGFFEDFDDVLFYGENAGGYAATAFSVAAPGCRVLALSPQATLNPRIAGFDQRYREQRINDFSSRYGYGPDMIDAAEHAFIAFDPNHTIDAIHAALFTKPNMTQLRSYGFGSRLAKSLEKIGILDDIVDDAMTGTLSNQKFGRYFRARRTYPPYLRKLFNQTMKRERQTLAVNVCAHAIRLGHTRFFADQFEDLTNQGYQPYRPVKIKAAE